MGEFERADGNTSIIIQAGHAPSSELMVKLNRFLNEFPTLERSNATPLILLKDQRSGAFYVDCHLDSKTLSKYSDLDAVLDPKESEDYKLNREIYTEPYAYQLMERDAEKGRSFEDLVVEYDKSYRSEKPLKVFGGQHRITAITESVKKGVNVVHGVRVYSDLSLQQKIDIATVNNTSIAVAKDLLDRMQEDSLGHDLREWCQDVGLLEKGQNFADRKSPEGIPTVRVARTLLVNFQMGRQAKKNGLHIPVVCSSGPVVDSDYRKLRDNIDWKDKSMETMGRRFAVLNKIQRERVLARKIDNFIEFANKALHPCVTAAWSFAAGYLQNDPKALGCHYELADVNAPADPLNAKALNEARLKPSDPDTYRGLGARMNPEELGRMLEVFLIQATRTKGAGINLKLANGAIEQFQAKKSQSKADKLLKGI